MADATWTSRGSDGLAAAVAVGVGAAVLGVLAGAAGPERLLLLPAALLGLGGVWLLFQLPDTPRLVLVLGVGVVTFAYEAGLQAHEVVYGLLSYAYLGHWYATNLLAGRRLIRTGGDVAVALFATAGIAGGAVLGAVFGADLLELRGEVLGISAILFYFPVKEAVVRAPRGPQAILAVLAWFGAYAAVRLGLLFHGLLTGATEWWQVLDARVSAGEVHLMAGFLIAAAGLVAAKGRWRVVFIGLVGLIGGGLVLSKSRGPWLATLLGLAVMLAILPGRERRRIALLLACGGLATAVLGYLFLGDSLNLILMGLVKRVTSIGGATTQDPSLLNRWAESGATWRMILQSPVLGQGWGVAIPYHNILSHGLSSNSFLHNGYLALWVKVGLWGLLLFLWAWIAGILGALRVAYSLDAPPNERALAAAALGALLAFSLLAVPSNPFLLMDQMATVTIVLALSHGLHQRWRRTAAPAAGQEARSAPPH